MSTEFQVQCDENEIKDEDHPLLYIWEYRKSGNDSWKSITYPTDGEWGEGVRERGSFVPTLLLNPFSAWTS